MIFFISKNYRVFLLLHEIGSKRLEIILRMLFTFFVSVNYVYFVMKNIEDRSSFSWCYNLWCTSIRAYVDRPISRQPEEGILSYYRRLRYPM